MLKCEVLFSQLIIKNKIEVVGLILFYYVYELEQ
jgi:hypothetical protein